MKVNYKKILLYLVFAWVYIICFKFWGTGFHIVLKSLKDIPYLISVLVYLSTTLILLFIIKKLKLSRILKEKGIGFGNGLKVGAFLVCLALFLFFSEISDNMAQGELQPPIHIIIFCLDCLFVGITEELAFRGIVQNKIYECFDMKTRKGVYLAVIVSGIIFGSVHITNCLSGVSFRAALMQAIAVSGVGVYFSAIYYRSNNIYTLIFLHALNDIQSMASSGIWGIGNIATVIEGYGLYAIGGFAIYFALGMFLLRKSKLKINNDQPALKES